MGDTNTSRIISPVLAPMSFDIPRKLHAIRENGDLMGLPFSLQGRTWIAKSADDVREHLLEVKSREDVAAFLTFAGYVVMLDAGSGNTTPAYPIKPEQVSDKLMAYVMEWKDACQRLLLQNYRYPPKPSKQSERSVWESARRGTGRVNAIPITFDWDASGSPRLTLRPDTRMEAAVLSCHAARVRNFRFGQCDVCGSIYQLRTKRKGRMYCSERCGKNVAQARYRARQKKKSKRKVKKEEK